METLVCALSPQRGRASNYLHLCGIAEYASATGIPDLVEIQLQRCDTPEIFFARGEGAVTRSLKIRAMNAILKTGRMNEGERLREVERLSDTTRIGRPTATGPLGSMEIKGDLFDAHYGGPGRIGSPHFALLHHRCDSVPTNKSVRRYATKSVAHIDGLLAVLVFRPSYR